MSSSSSNQPHQHQRRRSSLSWVGEVAGDDSTNNNDNTPPPAVANNNDNDTTSSSSTLQESPLAPAGAAKIDVCLLPRRSNSFSFSNNNNKNFSSSSTNNYNNTSSAFSNTEFDEARLEVQRKLLDQRHKNMRLNKTLKNVKTALRVKMEKVEQNLMEAEDQFAQMAMRNVKYVDDVTMFDSPKKAVLGIPPSKQQKDGSGSQSNSASTSANVSRRNSLANINNNNTSAAAETTAFDITELHHKHSSSSSSSSQKLFFNEHATTLHNYQPARSRSNSLMNSLSSVIHHNGNNSGGSVNFQGIRRFGFASAAMKALAEKENCEHAKELVNHIKQSTVPHQSLAPEVQSLFVRNPLQAVTQSLRQFHDQSVEWASEWKRQQNTAIENLCFIFMEEEHHHHESSKHHHHSSSNNNNHHPRNASILRDPRSDFLKELVQTTQQSQALLEEHMISCSDLVKKTLTSVVSEVSSLKSMLKASENNNFSGAPDDNNNNDGLTTPVMSMATTTKDSSASTNIVTSPFDMAASRLDYSKMASNRRSCGVQVGNNITREEQLQQELEDLRADYRKLHQETIDREAKKDEHIISLNENVSRLQNRLDLLHSCLKVQKEASNSSFSQNNFLNSLKDSDLLTISSSSTFTREEEDDEKKIAVEKAMKNIRREMEKATGKTAAATATSTTSSTLSSVQNSATNSPSPMRHGKKQPSSSAFVKISSTTTATTTTAVGGFAPLSSSSASSNMTSKDCSPDGNLDNTQTFEGPNNNNAIVSVIASATNHNNQLDADQKIKSVRAKINSARSSASATPVQLSSLNTTGEVVVDVGSSSVDVSFTASSVGDEDNNNESTPVKSVAPSSKKAYASTPPVKLSSDSQQQQNGQIQQQHSLGEYHFPNTNRTSSSNNNNNNTHAQTTVAAPPLSAKPRSASKRNSIVVLGSSSNNSSATTTPRTGNLQTLPSVKNSNSSTTISKPLGKMMTNTTTTAATTSARSSFTTNKHQQQGSSNNNKNNSSGGENDNSNNNNNNNSNVIQVSSSLKRMEDWKDMQAQLWQRRRSKLEAHTSYEGMLKLSQHNLHQQNNNAASSSTTMNHQNATTSLTSTPEIVLLQQKQQQMTGLVGGGNNSCNNNSNNNSQRVLSPVAHKSNSAPVLPLPPASSSFSSHDVLIDQSRRNSMMNSGTVNALGFVPKRR